MTLSSGDLRCSGGLQTQQQQASKADRAQAVRQRFRVRCPTAELHGMNCLPKTGVPDMGSEDDS